MTYDVEERLAEELKQADAYGEELLQRIEELEAAQKWQDMNSAPYNKTRVILLHIGEGGVRRYGTGWYMPLRGWQGWCENKEYLPPTHWKPLGPLPEVNHD